jgi:hypothetical protein
MIEPRLVEPVGVAADAPNATSVRLLETQGRGHIGRRLLHQQPGGEVTEDPVWLWASTPDRYLDSAVRYAIASSPDIRLVDRSSAPSLAVTLVVWQIESAPSRRLVGAVEVQVATTDRAVHSEIIRAEEPIAADLPGDLAVAAGRLLGRLATDCLSRVMAMAHDAKSLDSTSSRRASGAHRSEASGTGDHWCHAGVPRSGADLRAPTRSTPSCRPAPD